MSSPVALCPDQATLQRFLLAELTGEEAEGVGQHLLKCEACCQAARALEGQDTLVEALRQVQQTAVDTPLPAEVAGLIEGLGKMTPPIPDVTAAEGATLSPSPAAEHTEEAYDFLAPAQGPDELGRLGPYRVVKLLGAGGMGVVFQAEDPSLKRTVALKAMRPALAASDSARKRFVREAQATAAIEHDHIVHIYQVGEDRGVPFLAMQFLKGEALDDRLRREKKLPLEEVLRIGREVAEGLAAAHERGLIHRDIKPANVWLEGARGRVKVLDFGLARAVDDDSNLTQQGAVAGTPSYMAPEQARGEKVGARADLFSLGCLLYRLLTGAGAFDRGETIATLMAVCSDEPKPIHQLNSAAPPDLSALVMRLLAKSPEQRPTSAREVVEAIQAIEQSRTQVLPQATQGKQAGNRSRRRLLVGGVLAAVLLLGLGVGGYLLAPVVLRVEGPQGTLVVQIAEDEADNVQLLVKRGGRQVELVDLKTKKEVVLNAGAYELELIGGKEGLKLVSKEFELKRGERPIVKVAYEPRAVAKAPGPVVPPKEKTAGNTKPRPIPVPEDAKTLKGQQVLSFTGHMGNVYGVALSPDGKRIVSGGKEITAKVWDAESGKELLSLEGHTGTVSSVAHSPDGKRIVSGSHDQTVKVWGAATGKDASLDHKSGVSSVCFSADGKRIVSAGIADRTVKVWDAESGKELLSLKGHKGYVNSVAVSTDGKRIVSGSHDKTVKVWDAESGLELLTIEGHTRLVSSVAISPDGKRIAAGSHDNTINVWDAATGKVALTLAGHAATINSVAFSPDGNRLVSGSHDTTVKVWDAKSGQEALSLKGDRDGVSSVAFGADGKRIVCGGWKGRIVLWAVRD